jgi:hypothetical protein
MLAEIKKFFGLKGDTKRQLDDKYIDRLNGKAREDMIEVSTNLLQLQSEIKQFKEAIDNLATSVPGNKK